MREIFQIFKDLNLNISFADALILMPKFGPSTKSLLTNKDKLCELARTLLNEHCSPVLEVAKKLEDPGKFLIPCDFLGMAECLALADLGASINLMPLSVWNNLSLPDLSPMCMTLKLTDHSISRPVGVVEDVFVKVGTFHFPADFVVIDFDVDPRVPLILERSFLKTERALIDVFEDNYNDMTANRIDIIDMACEGYLQEVLGFYDMIMSGNPTPYYNPTVSTTSSTLTPFGNSDFLLEEVDAFLAFLALEDNPTSPKMDHSYVDSEGDILLLEAFLNDNPSLPLQTKETICPKIDHSLMLNHWFEDFLHENFVSTKFRVNTLDIEEFPSNGLLVVNSPSNTSIKALSVLRKDLSRIRDDTTPSIARKFLNEVKSTIVTLQRVVKHRTTLETHNWSSSAHQELHKIVKDENFPIVNQVDARVQNFEIQFLREAAKFVGDFKSLAKEADDSLAKHGALKLEIERLLRVVVSQDIMSVMQKTSVVDTSNLQTEIKRTKERFENYIIKKENEYAKLWNDWYKKCDDCKFDKISYDKAYKDMQQQIERLQAQLGDLKGKSKDTSCVSDTLNPSSQKLENENDNTRGTSMNTKFAKQSIVENPPKVGETHALSKPVTSNSVPIPQESKVMKNNKVIAPGMFRINPFKTSREAKHVPNNVRASARTKPITVSQPSVVTKKDVNSDSNGYPDLFMVRRLGLFQAHDLKLLINFVWKFMGTVRFENDHVVAILGFEGVDLLKGDRSTNLHTINLHEMTSASPICLMARASSTKSWLWHQRLSHLNFDTINDLARNDLVSGLPKFKYHKEHLCPSCEQGKSKRASHPPKPVPNLMHRLHLLHMDLCRPIRIASINGKRYVLVIVDDYSRYTWVHFLRSKDEAPEVIKIFLKRITVFLQSLVIIIRTDNGTEFKNQVLKEYFDSGGISHQMSFIRTPQQNGVVERRNRTLVEAARTMLIFSRESLFLWLKRLLLRVLLKTAPLFTNGREDIGKIGAKGDIGFFIGYSADSCAYRVYNRRTKKIMKTMNVSFDELSAMAFEQRSSKPGLQCMTSGQISSGLDLTYAPSTITTQQPSEGKLYLLFEAMYGDYIGGQPSITVITILAAHAPQ
nr:retrovirus-related Pol polyprotein from transposon TNT 1-94 [Tanacetum cinerariifolium]